MSTPRTSVKMAALAPMPSASVMITTNVNPGDLRGWRRANFRSFISFSAERLNWIYLCCASCRYHACEQSGNGQSCGGKCNQKGIMRRDLIKLRGDEMACADGGDKSDRQPNKHRIHPLPDYKTQHAFLFYASRQTH